MLRIAVASGKGGTGKTTIAASLSQVAAERNTLVLSDCDVEAPNAHLFFPVEFRERKQVSTMVPRVDRKRCSSCGSCAEVCQFHAIVILREKPVVIADLCHGCGSCALICPQEAVEEIPHPIGVLTRGDVPERMVLQQGKLAIGQPLAVPVIAGLKKWPLDDSPEIQIYDAPPGASCPVVEAVRGVDFVLLVTEPTPFGLHDLKQAYQVTVELGLPAGVIVNRDGVGDRQVEDYCQERDLPLLMRIPLKRAISEGTAAGRTLVDIDPTYREKFSQLLLQIESILSQKERL